jgi:hypothetical protein
MEPEWLTYAEAAERLNVSPHAVRARATRNGWRRQIGNDGRAKVLVALDPLAPDEPPMSPRSLPARKGVDQALVTALESHIKTLQGENETLRQQLRAETDRLAAAEARVDRAIAAFSAIAQSFDALAAERSRPWWRKLVG